MQKRNQIVFRTEKIIEKAINHMLNRKDTIIRLMAG